MTAKLIPPILITDSQFSSATEQEGAMYGIIDPDAGNTGYLRPVNAGAQENLQYSGTTTSNGATPVYTTLVDSVMAGYGDDFWIGATVAITSGICNGETRTVSDFDRATGTITVSVAFSAQIVSGVTFTVTIYSALAQFGIELVAGGDAGTATFKWSHDGGTTWLGRNNPDQTSWLNNKIIDTEASEKPLALKLQSGTVVLIYEESDSYYKRTSTDNGMTWSAQSSALITLASSTQQALIQLASGRVLLMLNLAGKLYYSDDNCATFTLLTSTLAAGTWDLIELQDGTLFALSYGTTTVTCKKSTDGGATWGSSVTVATYSYAESAYSFPRAVQLASGRIVVAYYDPGTTYIRTVYSDDNGATWGGGVNVSTTSIYNIVGSLRVDIDGSLYFAYSVGTYIYVARTTDEAVTWGTPRSVRTYDADYVYWPWLVNCSPDMLLFFYNNTDTQTEMFRRGMWEAYSANAITIPSGGASTKLICGVDISWLGGSGVAGDSWSFATVYDYGMENIIVDSPSVPWRSTQDNIACTILLDAGANARFRVTGAAFFGCNLRTLSFQMSADNSTWTVDETVTFDLTTGTIDSVSGNVIEDSSVFSTYKDHELAGLYFRATSGTDSGVTWQIQDNWGNYIILDTTAATNLANGNTFAIYQGHVSKTFTGGIYRYIRLSIAAQQCAEDYYQIGTMIAGNAITLTDAWLSDPFDYDYGMGLTTLEIAHGGLVSVDETGHAYRVFRLKWGASIDGRKEMLNTLLNLRGRAFCVIPDSATLTDPYLMAQEGDIQQSHFIGLTRYSMSVQLREVL